MWSGPSAGGSEVLLGMEVGAESQDRLEESSRVGSTNQGFVVPSRKDSGLSPWSLSCQWRREVQGLGKRMEDLLRTYKPLPLHHSTD